MGEGVGGRPVTPVLGPCRAFSPTRPCQVVAWISKQVSGGVMESVISVVLMGVVGGGGTLSPDT